MTTCFTAYDIRQKPILALGYVAFFVCGVSIAVNGFMMFSGAVSDDPLGPYILTIFLVGAAGFVGIILTFIQWDVILIILACLTIGLMISWRLTEGSTFFEVYLFSYAFISIAAPFFSCYLARHREGAHPR